MTIIEYNTRLDTDRLPIIKESAKYNVRGESLTNSDAFYDLCANVIGLKDAAEEYAYCFALDTKGKIIGLFEVGHGTINQSLVDVRGLFQKALILGAANIALAHNHPSGDPTPSADDKLLTKRVKDAAALLSIGLIEHLIIGDGTYYSFNANGKI